MYFDPEHHVFDLDVAEADLQQGGEVSVQFAAPLSDQLHIVNFGADGTLILGPLIDRAGYLARVNDLCARWKEKLTVRFFGHHGETFDGERLLAFPEVRSLCVNCLDGAAINLEAVGRLQHLKRLSFGVFELKDKQALRFFPLERLEELTLEETRTKALDLAPLERAVSLRSLRLFGHKKNIEAVGSLEGLESFVFNPAKTTDLQFLNDLKGLRSLKFVLGGVESVTAVKDCLAVEELAFTQVRGLSDVGDLQRFPALRRVLIQDEPHLEQIDTGAGNASLEHIWIYNCPRLSRINGLCALVSLQSLASLKTNLQLPDIDAPPTLTHLMVHSLKRRSEALERRAIEAQGLVADPHPSMPFFYK